MRTNINSAESDLETDFEYNFALTPFNYVLAGIHWLVAAPYHLVASLVKSISNRLRTIQKEKTWRRTFKGPACDLR